MSYPKTEPKANFPQLENQVLDYWQKNNIFHKTISASAAKKPRINFTFYDGPPTPSSKPHVGHLGVSAIKDMVFRYRTMQGNYVIHQFGWDVHGLPAEVTVEKQTGSKSIDIVAKDGIETFCDMCRMVLFMRYGQNGGRWVDFGIMVKNTQWILIRES